MTGFREYRLLLKLHLRMRLALSSLKVSLRTGKGRLKIIGFGLLFLYVIAALWFTLSLILYQIMGAVVEMGAGEVVVGAMILATMLVSLFLGTLSLLGLVFNAKDTELYAALPVRQGSVFAAKFSMVYLTELVFSLFILLPVGVIYSMHAGASLAFWLKFPLIALLVPVVPLVISSLLALPLMLLTARSRHRDAVMLVLSLVLMLALVFGQMYLSMSMQTLVESTDQLMEILRDPNGLSAVLGSFPPAMWAAKALLFGGTDSVINFLLLLAVSAVSFALAVLISSKLYYRGALAQLESARKGKSKAYSAYSVKAGKPYRAFLRKDIKSVLRTPVYAMNQLTMVIIVPIMLVIFKFMSGGNEAYQMLFGMLESSGTSRLTMTLVVSGVLGFLLLVNPQATTTFSRDGVSIFFIKSLPVSVPVQTAGRILSASLCPALGIVVTELTLALLLGLDAAVIVSSALIGLSAVALVTSACMIPDCLKPKLRWNSEAEAMKQNFNSMLGMLTGFVSLIPAIVAAVVLAGFQVALPVVTVCLMLLNAGLTFGSVALVNVSAENMLDKLE